MSGGVAMLQAALDLAEQGYRILPLHHPLFDGSGRCSCNDADCASVGKHPRLREWQVRATCDATLIDDWWAGDPWANIGVATGSASGLVVLDVDSQAALDALIDQVGNALLATAPAVRTGRGWHYYFRYPSDGIVIKNTVRLLGIDGVDLRGEGGYVVAPPSVHATGALYEWIGRELEPPDVPTWMMMPATTSTAVEARAANGAAADGGGTDRAERYLRSAIDAECAKLLAIGVGGRNKQLNASVFKISRYVWGGQQRFEGLVKTTFLNVARQAGLSELETRRTIKSGYDAAAKWPRAIPEPSASGAYADDDDGAVPPPPSDESAPHPADSNAAGSGGRITWVESDKIFAELFAQRWGVQGLQIGPGRPTLIAGYGASAKTLSAQSLALAKASGRLVWNRYECDPGVVLHIDYEQGHYGTAKRYQRLAKGHGISLDELGNRLRYAALPSVMLDGTAALDALLRACDGVELVIVDSLKASSPGLDENDAKIRTVLDRMNYVSDRTGAAFVLLHHAGKPREGHSTDSRTLARGHSAIFDAAGCVYNLVAGATGGDPKSVTQAKMPAEAEGAPIEPFELVVEDVVIGDAPSGGVRVVWRQGASSHPDARASATFERDMKRMLEAVRRAGPHKSQLEIIESSGLRKARAHSLLKVLCERGAIVAIAGIGRSVNYQVSTTKGNQ
jgi:hypothetical protein